MPDQPPRFKSPTEHVVDSVEIIKNILSNTQQTYVPDGHKMTITRDRKEDYGKFQAISELRCERRPNLDVFDLLQSVSNAAFERFNHLKVHRDEYTNICTIPVPYNNRSEQVMFNRHLSELKKIDLVKKIPGRRNTGSLSFMINPVFIRCRNYADAQLMWGQLK